MHYNYNICKVFYFSDKNAKHLKCKCCYLWYSGGNQHLHQCKTRNISFKCCSKHKSRDSFGFCSSWGFQNTPNMLKLIEFWLRYLRSKTNDRILKISSKLIKIDENLMKSTHFVSKVINSTSKTSHWLLKNDSHWHWCPQK